MPISLKALSDQVVVLTGASSGIGLCTAEAAAEAGAKLVLVARSEETLQRLVRSLNADGVDAMYVCADIGEADQAERIAALAIDRFGRIDTWINNAGVSIHGRLDEVPESDARRLFDVNFWGLVRGSLAALRRMRNEGGAIINVGSDVSEAAVALQGMYAASKHAVKGFTDALRVEVQDVEKLAIAVTLVLPTAVDTPFPRHGRNYTDREPQLRSPRIDPVKVAAAILEAATTPRREVKVGLMAKLNTTLSRLSPRLAKRLEGLQAGRQQPSEPPRDPDGTLYRPGESGHARGTGPSPADVRLDAGL